MGGRSNRARWGNGARVTPCGVALVRPFLPTRTHPHVPQGWTAGLGGRVTAFACLVLGHVPELVKFHGFHRCSRCMQVMEDEFVSESAMQSVENAHRLRGDLK